MKPLRLTVSMQPSITFNNKKLCPFLGLGTYKIEGDVATNVVKNAIGIGYRHFDCAYIYKNEKEVGKGLNDKINDGTVQRDELFVTSKLWNTFHKKELVVPALNLTLKNLGLTHLDLYLIHWPTGFKEGDDFYPQDSNGNVLPSVTHFTETWKGMEECVRLGLTHSIGLSNFNSKQIQEILDIATVKPVNNQVECHPYLNQSKLIKFCKANDITVTAYSPLGSPFRALSSPEVIRLLDDSRIRLIAEKYGQTVAQVLIAYQIHRDVIVIPKSSNRERLQINYEALSLKLSDEDMEVLNNLEIPNGRVIPFQKLKDHKDYPFNIEY